MIIVISSLIVFFFISRFLLVPLLSRKPKEVGLNNGVLPKCRKTPNCVSTLARKEDKLHYIEPIPLLSSVDDAKSKILDALASIWGKTDIILIEDNYIHAENRSPSWGFIDDIEFLINKEQKLIHFRSASRLGYSDNGVNRKRMELIRKHVS